jgi:hypothetical protein
MSLILDGTNGLSDVDGSAATPAIRGSDANTGVFFGTDIVGLSTGGSERVRVDASGNVGIGTDSPGARLDVNGNIHARGASFPAFKFANTSGTALAEIYYGVSGTDLNLVSNQSGGRIVFQTNGSERARIDSSGNLLVACTAAPSSSVAGVRLQNPNTAAPSISVGATTSSITMVAFINGNGTVGQITTNASATAYVTSSDYRLKHDIQPMTGALAKVAALKPVTYKWNADNSQSQGFIAHELQEVAPECVTGEKDAVDADGNPQYQGIDTSFLAATMVAAIQELKGINDAQAQIITALTARVEALEGAQA